MGLKWFDFIKPRNGNTELKDQTDIIVRDLIAAQQEYQIRNLAWMVCVNLIANAVSKCQFRTYVSNKEVKGDEYYLWNVEPNSNQSSAQFIHKMIAKWMADGECLIIATGKKNGNEHLAVADSFTAGKLYPSKQREYTDVRVGDLEYRKTFKESEVIHLTLPNKNLKEVVDAMNQSYQRLYSAAVTAYEWSQGKHWKVHVSQMAAGEDGWESKFQKMMEAQVRPFLESDGAVLPEFDGYDYQEIKDKNASKTDTRDIKALANDIFEFTARGFLIPPVLVVGSVENTGDATNRWLSVCIDPLMAQLQQEIIRKRYGQDKWSDGNYLIIDTSMIRHFDMINAAASVEKLIGSGLFTPNDLLKALGKPTIDEPWANTHYMTLNFTTVDLAMAGMGKEKNSE